jgi:hypothetical protein
VSDEQTPAGAAHEPHEQHSQDADASGIDVARLADKVYALMRAELRLEKARGAARMRAR